MSTLHGASRLGALNDNNNVSKMKYDTITLYDEPERDTGPHCGIHQPGMLFLALTPDREHQLRLQVAKAKYFDVEFHEVSRREAEALVRREHVQEFRHPGIAVIGAPPDDRSFLMAAKNQAQVIKHYRRGAVLGLSLFFLLLAVGVTLISMRLG